MPDVYHKHMTQKVTSDPNWAVNCTAYCAAMMLTDATLGGMKITGRIVRALSNEPRPDPKSPGLNLTQIIDVARTLYVPITNRTGEPWSAIEAALREGRRVMLGVEYDELGRYQEQKAGSFDHAMLLIRASEAVKDHTRASDPLARESRAYPDEVLQRAARAFARRTGQEKGLRWAATRIIPLTDKSVD